MVSPFTSVVASVQVCAHGHQVRQARHRRALRGAGQGLDPTHLLAPPGKAKRSLDTSFSVFKYMALYSLTQFISVLILYTVASPWALGRKLRSQRVLECVAWLQILLQPGGVGTVGLSGEDCLRW